MWNDLNNSEQAEETHVIDSFCTAERLSCFAHTEQLVDSDRLKETKVMSAVISKSSRLSTLWHTSSTFHDNFEMMFGKGSSILAENATRRNCTLRQLKRIAELDKKKLTELLQVCGHGNVIYTSREWSQLLELVDILGWF